MDLKSPACKGVPVRFRLRHHLKSRVCGRKLMQTLVCFQSAILELVRNSLGGSDFLAHAITDVLLGHHHGRCPR